MPLGVITIPIKCNEENHHLLHIKSIIYSRPYLIVHRQIKLYWLNFSTVFQTLLWHCLNLPGHVLFLSGSWGLVHQLKRRSSTDSEKILKHWSHHLLVTEAGLYWKDRPSQSQLVTAENKGELKSAKFYSVNSQLSADLGGVATMYLSNSMYYPHNGGRLTKNTE